MGGVAVGAHYAASKAGLIALSKSLAQLLAPDGVTVNCVAPGTTATDLTGSWSEAARTRPGQDSPGPICPAGRNCRGGLFLASDRAAFITGATLDMNGGLYPDDSMTRDTNTTQHMTTWPTCTIVCG